MNINPYAYKMHTNINNFSAPPASHLNQKASVVNPIYMQPDPNRNKPKYESVIDTRVAPIKPEDVGKTHYTPAPIHVPKVLIPPTNKSLNKLPLRFTSFASMYAKQNNIPYKKALKDVDVANLYKKELVKLGYKAVPFRDEDYQYDTQNQTRHPYYIPKAQLPSGVLVANNKTEPVEPMTSNEQKELKRLKMIVKGFEKSMTSEYLALCSNNELKEIKQFTRTVNNIGPLNDAIAEKIFQQTEKEYGDVLIISPFSEFIENSVVKDYKTKKDKTFLWSPFPRSTSDVQRNNPNSLQSARRLLNEFGHKTILPLSRNYTSNNYSNVSTCLLDRKGAYSSYLTDIITLLMSGTRNLNVYLVDTRNFNNIVDLYKVFLAGQNLNDILRFVRPSLFNATRTNQDNLITNQDIEELKFYLLKQESITSSTKNITKELKNVKDEISQLPDNTKNDIITAIQNIPATDNTSIVNAIRNIPDVIDFLNRNQGLNTQEIVNAINSLRTSTTSLTSPTVVVTATRVISDEAKLLAEKARLNSEIERLEREAKEDNRLYYIENPDKDKYLLSTFYIDKEDNTKIYLLFGRQTENNYLTDGKKYNNKEINDKFINILPIPGSGIKTIERVEDTIKEQPKYVKRNDITIDRDTLTKYPKIQEKMDTLFSKANTNRSAEKYSAFIERTELKKVNQQLDDIIKAKEDDDESKKILGEGINNNEKPDLNIMGGALFNNMITLWNELFPISNFEIFDRTGQDNIYKLSFNR